MKKHCIKTRKEKNLTHLTDVVVEAERLNAVGIHVTLGAIRAQPGPGVAPHHLVPVVAFMALAAVVRTLLYKILNK